MELRSIEIFLAFCETGSMSAAARRLGITQAAVSQQFAKLEKELGVDLIDRAVRPPRLSPAGANLRERGQRLLVDVGDIRHQLERYRNDHLPELRVGIIESIGNVLLPQLVPMLQEIARDVSLTCGMALPLVPGFLRGELDIVITSESLDEIDPIEVHPLIREPFVAVLPSGHEPPREPADLLTLSHLLTFVSYQRDRRMAHLIQRHLERHRLSLPSTLCFDSSFPILDTVRRGLGWTITTPLCVLASGIPPEELVLVQCPGRHFSRRIDVVAPRERLVSFADKIAAACVGILQARARPELARYSPEVAEQLIFGPD